MFQSIAQILIVDDHEMIREGIRTLLSSRPHWHICGEAIDGLDALEKARTLRPDLVLMDISMPRMDGLTAMRILKRDAPGARVIIVTQNDAVEHRKEGMHADGYVLKVHLHRDLLPTIDSVLHSGSPASAVVADVPAVAPPRVSASGPQPSQDLNPMRSQSAGLLAAIVDSSDDAIISKDLHGIVTSWNRGAERLYGYAAAEMLGQPILRIIPDDHHDEERSIIARIRRGDLVEHFETVRIRKDGTCVDCSVTVSPVMDLNGRVIGASNLSRDITERKRAENALRESQERLRSLAQELEKMVRARTLELERRNQEIEEQSEQLRELSNRLQQGQDQERRRIARELHDSAGQLLAVLKLNLGQARDHVADERATRAIDHSEQIVDQIDTEIRTMSYLLHPPLLDENGLCGAVRWYARGLRERGGLAITVDISDDFPRLPNDMEVALFRIIQECLTNIHRHAECKTATIRLHCGDDGAHLEVSDDGCGMAAGNTGLRQKTGVGITGMRERVRAFAGSMNIESSDRGTTVTVLLPLPRETECDGSAAA